MKSQNFLANIYAILAKSKNSNAELILCQYCQCSLKYENYSQY